MIGCRHEKTRLGWKLWIVAALSMPHLCHAQRQDLRSNDRVSPDMLNQAQWRRLDHAVENGLNYIASGQQADGSFAGPELGQPGITSLSILAFLASGRVPDQSETGKRLNRAIDYVMSKQRSDGLIFGMRVGNWHYGSPAHTGIYNHAIAGLMLSEAYGMCDSRRAQQMRHSIVQAVHFTLEHQGKYRRNAVEQGGWRYLRLGNQYSDADLSISAWQLMFLRSAKNAGFEVPSDKIDDATRFVQRCFDPKRGTFTYCIVAGRDFTPAMAGAGIVSLAMAGEHKSESALVAGKYVLNRLKFDRYNRLERYHYSAYYCSQAMFQLGGDYWIAFYPRLMETLVKNQRHDGSWEIEAIRDGNYGNTYSSALAILALTPPYQQLPIYQR